MAKTATFKCKCCGNSFEARVADRARGWAKFCSKSCKAIRQTALSGGKSSYPRHDGRSEMKHKWCEQCDRRAVNGLYEIDGNIHWYCHDHMALNSAHPFSGDALGQW